MNKYVIIGCDGYYTGSSYIFIGERFAVFDKNIHRAKIYTSLKRATNACEKLKINCTNCIEYYGGVSVMEVSDGIIL